MFRRKTATDPPASPKHQAPQDAKDTNIFDRKFTYENVSEEPTTTAADVAPFELVHDPNVPTTATATAAQQQDSASLGAPSEPSSDLSIQANEVPDSILEDVPNLSSESSGEPLPDRKRPRSPIRVETVTDDDDDGDDEDVMDIEYEVQQESEQIPAEIPTMELPRSQEGAAGGVPPAQVGDAFEAPSNDNEPPAEDLPRSAFQTVGHAVDDSGVYLEPKAETPPAAAAAGSKKAAIALGVVALWGTGVCVMLANDNKPAPTASEDVTMETHVDEIFVDKIETPVMEKEEEEEEEDVLDLDALADSAKLELPEAIEGGLPEAVEEEPPKAVEEALSKAVDDEPCDAPASVDMDVPTLDEIVGFWQNECKDQADTSTDDLSVTDTPPESSGTFSQVIFRDRLETGTEQEQHANDGSSAKSKFWAYVKTMGAWVIVAGCSKRLVELYSNSKDTEKGIPCGMLDLTDFDTLLDFIIAFETAKSNSGRRSRSPPAKKGAKIDQCSYEKLTIPELKTVLGGFNAKTSGNKATLIQTLMEHYEATLMSKGFTRDKIAAILKAKGVSFSSKAKKDDMIRLAVQAGF